MYKKSDMPRWLKSQGADSHRRAEAFGWATSAQLAGLIGAGIGKKYGRSMEGRLIGLFGTAIAAPLIGRLAAAITRRRTLEEQKRHDERPAWLDTIIPGLSSYNSAKYEELADSVLQEKLENI